MSNVFDFLNVQLTAFSDDGGIYDEELKSHCIKLNEYLNNVIIPDYEEHIKKVRHGIRKEISDISNALHQYLYIDLSELHGVLYGLQRDKRIKQRDHYYHSIQCFLLSISLLNLLKRAKIDRANIILVLYLLTLYHDIGYEYYSVLTVDEINKALAKYFTFQDPISQEKALLALCIENDLYDLNYDNGLVTLIEKVKKSKEIYSLWINDTEISSQRLKSITDIDIFPDGKEHHHYNSALLLTKSLQTKEIIQNYYHEILFAYKDQTKFEERLLRNKTNEELFRNMIKPILLHGFSDMRYIVGHLLSIETEFLSSYLMIIDELQTYGRQLGTDPKLDDYIINPKDVGFHWDNNREKLILDIISTDISMRRKCSKHSNEKIRRILRQKLDVKSLKLL
jgi:hypothetical protein